MNKREYISQPPYIHLGEVLEVAQEVYVRGGGEVTKDMFSKIINSVPSSSMFRRKITAGSKFGVFSMVENKISLTALAYKCVAPHSDEERAEALLEFFLNLPEFKVVHDKFKGKILDPTYLPNFLEREAKVNQKVKKTWAECLIESGIEAGILLERADGRFQVLETPIGTEEKGKTTQVSEQEKAEKQIPPIQPAVTEETSRSEEKSGLNIILDISTGKMNLFIPGFKDLNDLDCLLIYRQLEGIVNVIKEKRDKAVHGKHEDK